LPHWSFFACECTGQGYAGVGSGGGGGGGTFSVTGLMDGGEEDVASGAMYLDSSDYELMSDGAEQVGRRLGGYQWSFLTTPIQLYTYTLDYGIDFYVFLTFCCRIY
jgi:hypothetical protein